MSYERLVKFAQKISGELHSARLPFTVTDARIEGWSFDSMLMDETTISGRDVNTEVLVLTDELWLNREGELKIVRSTLSSVIGRTGTNRSVRYSVDELPETYALMRDGIPTWRTWIDKRGPGVRADRGSRTFSAPKPDRPQCLTVSAALGRIRPPQ